MIKRKVVVGPVLRVFWQHIVRYKLAAILSTVSVAIVVGLEVVVPLYYKRLFDTIALAAGPSLSTAEILIAILFAILGLQVLSRLVREIGQFFSVYFQARIMHDLSQTAFVQLLKHSYGFFINNFSGALVRKVSRLPRAFEQFADRVVYDFLPLLITLIGIVLVLFFRHVFLGTAFLVWVVFLVTLQFFVARWKVVWNVLIAEKDSETVGVLSDAVSNDVTVKLFGGSTHEQSFFGRVSQELTDLRLAGWRRDEVINLIQGVLSIIIEFLLIYGAIRLWQRGVITVGDFALVQAYLISATSKLWNVSSHLRRIYEAFADATEMVEIMDLPPAIKDEPGATALAVPAGQVAFHDVAFSFRGNRDVLRNFNMTIAGKEKVALVGPSGAGKSTVVKLLFRFYDLGGGSISIDGQNIAEVTQDSLRNNIALVPQEPVLFHRTLMENIRYGRREASDEEVVEAAKQAHCYEFIKDFPDGFNTYVGERGVKLSGGERQRVAIARAILKNAPILVLDEATSSLDSESESFIQEALAKLMEGKTVIVIAHRLSTVMKMDRIVVIEGGQVVTTGTHEELLSHEGGLYKKLWEIQAGGFLRA